MVRRALCIGCNYPGSKMKLNGCVNDCATNVQLCINKLGVPPHEVIVLTDEECPGVSGTSPPTKANIISSIKKLVQGAQAGDMFYFSYSGHGTQVVDRTGEEEDGMDEAIVPGDYAQTKRVITDDELDAYLVKPLPEGALLTAIFDCCHSGTILDLDTVEDSTSGGGGKSKKDKKEKGGKKKYKKGKSEKELKEEFAEAGNPKAIPALMDYVPDEIPEPEFCARGMGGPTVFCFAGCRDDQTSLDVTLNGKPCGALTNSLEKAFSDKGGVTSDYESVFRSACLHMNDLRKTIPQMTQCPQFTYTEGDNSSSTKFCQPGSVGGGAGYTPDHPPTAHGKEDKEDKKGKKEKEGKEKKEKGGKEKKEKGGKNKDLDDGSDSSASEDNNSKKEKKDKKEKH